MKKLCICILVLLFVFTIGFSQEKAQGTKKENPKTEEVKPAPPQQTIWGLLPSHRAKVQELMAEFDQKMVAYIMVIRVDMAAIGIQIPANVQLNYAKLQLELIPAEEEAKEEEINERN